MFKPCLAALTSLITLLSALPPGLAEDPQTLPVTPGPDLTPADLKRLGVIPSRLPGAEALRDLCQNAGGIAISQRDCDRLQQGDLPIRLNARNGSAPASDPVTGIPLGRASGTLLPPSSNPISVAVAFLGNQLGGALNVAQYFNRSPRPAGLVGNGNRGLLFRLVATSRPFTQADCRPHGLDTATKFRRLCRLHSSLDREFPAPLGRKEPCR